MYLWCYLQSESSKSLFKTGSRHSLEKVAVVVFFAVSDAVFSMAGISPWHLQRKAAYTSRSMFSKNATYLFIDKKTKSMTLITLHQ